MKYFNSQDARNLINTYKFSIFPIHGTKEDGLCTCNNPNCTNIGKHPATPDGFKSASKDIERVKKLWAGRQGLNVGIATGKPSGIFVVDIDSAEGEKGLNELCNIPETLTVKTGKGKHIFFKYPNKEVITKKGILEGVDVRGDGGYVAGAGSIHSSGHIYDFINPLAEIAEAPQEILDLVLKENQTLTNNTSSLNLNTPQKLNLYTSEGWSLDDIKGHLSHISPDIGYDEWIKVGMALHQEGVPFYVWDEWSRTGTKYDGNTKGHWKSFKATGGVTYGTVVAYAKQGGWKPRNAVTPTAIARISNPVKQNNAEDEESTEEYVNTLYCIEGKDITINLNDTALIKDVLGQEELSVIYGESNCGKTFFMSDLSLHVARGVKWNDHRVTQGAVMYAALEGAKGLSGRYEAYCKHHNIDKDLPFAMMPCALDFYSENANVEEFVNLIKAKQDTMGDFRLIVIDTLSRALVGGDENSGHDMGRLVYYADLIRRETNAHLSFVHHSGKNKALGARGHSSLRAAVDTEIEISREEGDNHSVVRFVKQREMEMIDDKAFSLKSVVIGVNNFTEEITSCVVTPAEIPERQKTVIMNAMQQFIYDNIINAMIDFGKVRTVHNDMQPVKCITYTQFYDSLEANGFRELLETENKTTESQVKYVTQNSRIWLRKHNKIGFNNLYIWLIDDINNNS